MREQWRIGLRYDGVPAWSMAICGRPLNGAQKSDLVIWAARYDEAGEYLTFGKLRLSL